MLGFGSSNTEVNTAHFCLWSENCFVSKQNLSVNNQPQQHSPVGKTSPQSHKVVFLGTKIVNVPSYTGVFLTK